MKLGIVGHGQEKFTDETESLAIDIIHRRIKELDPEFVVSGHSPMGGVDIYAEIVAKSLDIPVLIHAPKVNRWDGAGGFRERNLAIARDSDVVLVVVVKELPPGYTGMRFDGCYHCKDRNPEHVKSGGCWTAWRCFGGQEWTIIKELPE